MARVFALAAMAALYSHAAAADPPRTREIEERKDDLLRQLAICESGGYGDSEKPIFGGGGAYVGRFQFTIRAVKVPNLGGHTLFSIMTTEPNGIVEPIHAKAMPVMLMTPDDVDRWLHGRSVEDALQMQKPAPDDSIVIRPPGKKVA